MQRPLNLFFGLALALSAAACAGARQEAATPEASPAGGDTTVSTRSRTTLLPEQAPSTPDNLGQNQAKQIPQPVKDAAADPNVADAKTLAAQEEAKDEAEANARDAEKWQKLGRDQDRKNTDEYARDRLAKAISRVSEAQNQSARIQGARRLKFTHDVNDFDAKRVDVKTRIDELAATGSDEWRITKDSLDDALNELDALSYRVAGDL